MTSYIYRASAIVAAISAFLVFTSADSIGSQSELEAIAAQSPNQTFTRRALPEKPVWTKVHGGHQRDSINFKLLDSSQLFLSGQVFTSASPEGAVHASDLMSILQGASIAMLVDADPEQLKHERAIAMANLGREIADISKWYSVEVPAGTDIELLINKLNELSFVEIAVPVPLGAPPPSCTMSVNCQADQVYLGVQGPSEGINATAVWGQLGANGQGVRISNIEWTYGTHSDLPSITNLNGHPAGDTVNRNHGTNTFGVMASKNNSLGTRGIAYGATYYFVSSVNTNANICTHLLYARNAMQPGDVILIEKQIWVDSAQTIRGPVEHHQSNYDCIVLTVGLGYNVVETAGNGSLDLDSSAAAAPHNPYHPLNHSGAIMVGAGSMDAHSALWFSNYGSRVDVQGWGEGVLTTNAIPTDSFVGNHGGTSAAGAMVAGVVALIQSAYKNSTGKVASPQNILNALVLTGLAQTGSKHIGPLPNATQLLRCFSLFPVFRRTSLFKAGIAMV